MKTKSKKKNDANESNGAQNANPELMGSLESVSETNSNSLLDLNPATLESFLLEFPEGGKGSDEVMEAITMDLHHMELKEEISDIDLGPIASIQSLSVDKEVVIIDRLRYAADAFDKWENAEKAWRGSKQLKTFSKFISTSKTFAKASAGLGILGSGLVVVSVFASIGQESDTEKILNAIGELDKKLDYLESRMAAHFINLSNENRVNAAKTDISGYINTLGTLQALVRTYKEAALDTNRKKDAAERLLDFNRGQVLSAVKGIANNVYGGSFFATSIIEATYDLTYGDVNAVTEVGSALLAYAKFGLIADTLIGTLELERDGKLKKKDGTVDETKLLAAAKNVEELYQSEILHIFDKWNEFHNRCISKLPDNVDRKMREKIMPSISANDHEKAVNILVRELGSQWFWMDWLSIVYDPITGGTKHALYGWGIKYYFRQQIAGGKANIVIKWVDKNSPPKGANWPTTINKTKLENASVRFLSKIHEDLNKQIVYPGLFWVCRREKGVRAQWTNSKRMTWINGRVTIAICI